MLKKMVAILAGTVLSVTVSANVQASTITVEKGDTLWDLSRANNTTVKDIKMVNYLTSDLIHPGDELTIANKKQYSVKQGDTLWDIAMAHQVSVSQIKEWNQLHTDLIHPDLNLVIFEEVKSTTASTNAEKPVQTNAGSVKENIHAVTTPKTQEQVTSKPAVPAAKTEKETSKPEAPPTPTNDASAKEVTVTATAYTASCEGCSGITSTGLNLKDNPDAKVISVDPSVIPLGSKVYVEGYGEAIAGDTGGAIKGNKIDVFIPSKQDAINFGVKQVKVTILD
ncbi:LysM peptidoglycan-binding and 3D domain-containing protein [Bacillus sinesaloumensis]|uniref:LysM peptidoglycan-binding and 3D domain-containing protein n=1 Tax=Litchfieldia sinesaloumensis TaxID=1926280 RepID=UPI0009884B49|nr:3D domain-containing protein [Bacillus sinesaloumensis]